MPTLILGLLSGLVPGVPGLGPVPSVGDGPAAVCPAEAVAVEGGARFVVRSDDASTEISYETPDNLVFCRATSPTRLWIRLAEEAERDGQGGPHLDIDICDATTSATFAPMTARANPCPGEGVPEIDILEATFWIRDSR